MNNLMVTTFEVAVTYVTKPTLFFHRILTYNDTITIQLRGAIDQDFTEEIAKAVEYNSRLMEVHERRSLEVKSWCIISETQRPLEDVYSLQALSKILSATEFLEICTQRGLANKTLSAILN